MLHHVVIHISTSFFYSQIIFSCIDRPHFVYPFILIIILLGYYEWSCYKYSCTNVCMDVCFYFSWVYTKNTFSFLLGIYLELELPSHMVTLRLMFEELPNFSPKWLQHSISPLAMYNSSFFTCLPTLAIICLSDYNYPSRNEATSHCGFDLHFCSG